MKILITSLFLIVFLFGNDCLFAQNSSVKPVKKEFFRYDTLSFLFNGVLGGSEWNPLWGALKRSANGWDTLIDVRHLATMQETITYSTFNNYKRNFIVLNTLPIVLTTDRLYSEHLLLSDGEYVLTALSKDGKQIIYSEPFSMNRKTIIDSKLAEELRLSPDTVAIGNNRLFLKGIFVWRNMMPKLTNESSGMIAKGQLISDEKELLNGITLKKHYIVQDDRIWMSNYNESEIRKPIHKNYIEAVVRDGPVWKTNTIADVVWEFEHLGITYRIIVKSIPIGGVE